MPWATEDSLPNEFAGNVLVAEFGYRQQYRGGEVPLLIWTVETDRYGEMEVSFPIGSGWEVVDAGRRVVGKKLFQKNSIYGKIIDAAVAPVEQGGMGIADLLAARGEPTEAEVWEGLTFYFERVEINYGDEIGSVTRLLPTKFLGEGVDPAGAAAPEGGEAAKAEAETDAEGEEAISLKQLLEGLDDKTAKKLQLLARRYKNDVVAFQEAALDLDLTPTLTDALVDEDLAGQILSRLAE